MARFEMAVSCGKLGAAEICPDSNYAETSRPQKTDEKHLSEIWQEDFRYETLENCPLGGHRTTSSV